MYARWRTAPKYRLNNLAGDASAWAFIDLTELELLAFDQCLVFGAAYPGTAAELPGAMRRDAVVRQVRDATWAAYRSYAGRSTLERRLGFVHELASALELGISSAGALLPAAACETDAVIVFEARQLLCCLAEAAPA